MGKKLVRLPPVPPVCPEQQRRLHMMLEKAQVNAKVVDLNRAAPPSMSPEEYRRLAARFRRPGPPTPVAFIPGTVVDLSAHTCATRGEADIYKDLANAPDDAVFMILDPATGIADDEFKASIIKRYRGIPDEVLGGSGLKRHRQDESVDTNN
ncbi:hypothetical protein CTI12_AA360780 [Artemisia annua]|uniref:Uncharacterized protein n=1 Tax=Artemisia annua TaxID=35608 RepID=A0A2U1MMN0_ARTAN|nr:hypothetical protein CTI12_AA360780 [Artemisia annua]